MNMAPNSIPAHNYKLQLRLSITCIGYSVKRLKYVQNIAPISSGHRSRSVSVSDLKLGLYPRGAVSYERAKYGVRAMNSFWVTAVVGSDTRLNGLNTYKLQSTNKMNMFHNSSLPAHNYKLQLPLSISWIGYSVKRLKYVQNIAPVTEVDR